ncbi:DUF1206 domain-containing protein [Microbacterium sp. STN6]|uniref:DUF1206 domain-containing protein n=1 Tax=Microbacterium sp. STN6 TaxID=2995588 RepID=UPI002260B58B|nr:DUF1206 domain-containing protein [Microbacterium sp. STN6]MCX7522801.1 DUF1206 domain-containing protein [Microbacterium sp. STN6]
MRTRSSDRERLEAVARRVNSSLFLRILARTGLVANGIVHVIVGVIAITVAYGLKAQADQSGALEAIARTPGGILALWVASISLFALALWQLTDAAWVTALKESTRIVRRSSDVGKAFGFAVVGGACFVYAVGGRSSSTHTARRVSRWLLENPPGTLLLLAAAGVMVGIGVAHLVRGIRRRFRDELMPLQGARRVIVYALGMVGHFAKAVGFLVAGGLFTAAALIADPERAAGLDGALKYLTTLPSGRVLLVIVAVGLMAYGLYLFARARYMKLGA